MDRKQVQRILTEQAAEQFRKVEAKRLQLELEEAKLTKMLDGRIDTDTYVTLTERIRAQFEQKRVEAVAKGRLPREVAVLWG